MKRLISMIASFGLLVSASAQLVETRAYYATNPNGAVGKTATITIDGEFSDWDESTQKQFLNELNNEIKQNSLA